MSAGVPFPGTRQTEDDGAYDHLRRGRVHVPSLTLPSTTGGSVDVVADTPWTVVFLYPATGVPGVPSPDGWDAFPGAHGCTAETCAFRDLAGEFAGRGASLRGVSTQAPDEQAEFAEREHVTFPLLSDHQHRLVDALALPTFSVGGSPDRIRRATLVVDAHRLVQRVLYPVSDPPGHADEVLALLSDQE